MKKLLSLILAVLIALLPSLSMAENGEPSKTKLLSLWSEYLAIQDKELQNSLLVCDALIALEETRTWEQMLRTRAVVAAAVSNRSALGNLMLSDELSAAEQLKLTKLGVDVQPYVIIMEELNQYLAEDLMTLLEFNLTLLGNSFDVESLNWTKEWAELKKQSVTDDAVWLCNMTNHLFNTFGDEDQAVAYWAQMDTAYPCLAKFKEAFNADDKALEAHMENYVTQLEKNLTALSEHASNGAYIVDSMIYALETGSPYFSKENMIVYEGAPAKLPLAPWWGELGNDIFAYYTLDEESNMNRITVDSDLSVTPNVEVVQTSGVAKQDVMNYAAYLMDIGMEASSLSGSEMDEEPFSVTLRKGHVMLMIYWSNGSASVWNVGNKAMFIPDWYIVLANQK